MVCSQCANMCLCLAIKSVLAFTRSHCVVAVGFGSVIVTGSEATQKCFCEISAPREPSGSRQEEAPHRPSLLQCRGAFAAWLLWPLQKGKGLGGEWGGGGGQKGKPLLQSCLCLVDGRTACPCEGKLEHPSYIVLFGSFLPGSPLWPCLNS